MPSYVITGASRGIGLEFVRQLSDNSLNQIFAVVRNPDNSPHLIPLTKRQNVHVIQADTTSVEQLKRAAEEIGSITGGSLDVLIANAGGPVGSSRSTSLANQDIDQAQLARELTDNFENNLTSVVITNNAFLSLLKHGTEKKIIDISSGLGDAEATLIAGFSHIAPYSIAKAALSFAVVKYAAELADENFTVIALAPGFVDTSSTRAGPPPTEADMKIYSKFIESWKKVQPEWDGRRISVEESVQKQLKVIESVGPKDSGSFLSQYGNKTWM